MVCSGCCLLAGPGVAAALRALWARWACSQAAGPARDHVPRAHVVTRRRARPMNNFVYYVNESMRQRRGRRAGAREGGSPPLRGGVRRAAPVSCR